MLGTIGIPGCERLRGALEIGIFKELVRALLERSFRGIYLSLQNFSAFRAFIILSVLWV
jgi:hypothetical protein